MTWVSRRAMSLSGEWREEMEARAKRGDQRAGANAKVLLGSSTLVFAATRTLSDYARWKSRQSSDHGPPWATSLTFDVKGSDLKLWLDDEGGLHCRMALLGMSNGHRQEQPEFVLHPDGGSAWANVRAILGGEYEQRSAKVERTAEGIRNNLVGGKERESQTANVHARIVQLAEENKALKAKVRSLETEIRHLKKRLGKVIEKEQPQA